MPTTLYENRPSAGIGVVEAQNSRFFAFSAVLARPSAGISVVEVQKLRVFLPFLRCSRDPLRGSAWPTCKKLKVFRVFCAARATLCGDRRRISVVEVQKLEVFCVFCGARATLCGDRRGRGAKTPRGSLRALLFELFLGSCLVVPAPTPWAGGSRVRFPPGPSQAKAVTFKYESSTQSPLPQLELENRKLQMRK